MGIYFYRDRTVEIYNGLLKKKIYAANIANKIIPLILITRDLCAVWII